MNQSLNNKLAVRLSKLEGQKVNLPIAQLSEVLKCLKQVARKHPILVMRYLFGWTRE